MKGCEIERRSNQEGQQLNRKRREEQLRQQRVGEEIIIEAWRTSALR